MIKVLFVKGVLDLDQFYISKNAKIGDGAQIGVGAVVYDNVVIGKNAVIEPFSIIGSAAKGAHKGKVLEIGDNCIIRSHSVIYEGSKIGEDFQTGHHTLVREGVTAGKSLHIGSFSDIEGDCCFGNYVSCHSYVHVGKYSNIGSFVKLYSLVTLTNDPLPPSNIVRGSKLEDGVVVCVGSTVLPGAHMGIGSFAPAGVLVQGQIEAGAVVPRSEGERILSVSSLMDFESGTRHPWMRHFKESYPSETHEEIEWINEKIRNQK